jgi:hypothetical protein
MQRKEKELECAAKTPLELDNRNYALVRFQNEPPGLKVGLQVALQACSCRIVADPEVTPFWSYFRIGDIT